MSSNGKPSDSNSEKPKRIDAGSILGPIKPTGASYVSSSLTISDPHSKKAKGAASVSSDLTTPSGKTAVSSGVSIGVPQSKNPNRWKANRYSLKLIQMLKFTLCSSGS